MLRNLLLFLLLLSSGILAAQVNLNLGLKAYYPFNGNANDVSGNGNNGTLMNGVQLTTDRFGNPNSAYLFDGIDDYISVANSTSLNPPNGLSIAAYFNTSSSSLQCLLGKIAFTGSTATQYNFGVGWSVAPGAFFGVNSITSGCTGTPVPSSFVNTGNTISQNTWHCVVGTFDNGTMKIYFNGVLVQTIASGFTTINQCANATLRIGMWWSGDSQMFQGKIDEVRIYDRAINQDEVNALCTQQVTASFTAPDTVCVNTPVNITNTSSNASTYYWSFCAANPNTIPTGVNLGNPGGLSAPVFSDIVNDNGNYYVFVTNNWPGKLVRLDFGNSLLNTPTSVDMGSVGGLLPNTTEGIQVVRNNGKWYAIILAGDPTVGFPSRIMRLDFGANITNTSPVGTNWGNIGNLAYPVDLHMFQEGGNWYGLTINSVNNTVTRFNFTNDLNNTPTGVNLGNLGGLSYPSGIYAINNNGNWHVFIPNDIGNSLVRLDFGSSLLNTPTAVNLGSLGAVLVKPRDIYILKECGRITGFVTNGQGINQLIKLDFNNDLTSVPSATNLGNIGTLNFPHSISELFRVGDDLYSFITNVGNNTITRLRFSGCSSSTPGNSTLQNPPPVIYSTPGIYNISLTVDDGLATQSSFCKQVVVLAAPSHSPTQNIPLCNVQNIKIGSAVKPATYLWSTGSTADSIIVNAPGIYWVESNRYGCMVRDSFNVFRNIDSVRIASNQPSCSSFSFNGLGYTNTNPIAFWQWYFGDGGTATTQNANHTYLTSGAFPVKLVVTDANGCKDSITINVTTGATLGADFSYSIDPCNPLAVQFNSVGAGTVIPDGDFGDGSVWTGQSNPFHIYTVPGNYLVQFYYNNGVCRDTVRKTIQLGAIQDNIILTQDTTICFGATKKLFTVPALSFCWTPATYLDNPNSPQPTTSAPHSITYYYMAEVTGNNVITNGNFSSGNTGFTSDYTFANPNTTEGQYTVGVNPQTWNGALSSCTDHTTGNGNMMLVNGSPVVDATVWKQTVTVLPNTNYAFSTWIQSVSAPNPAQLQFSINGRNLGNPISASATACSWAQFYTTWNSGSNTSAVISIVNKNTQASGNDFALDDISFAPVFIKRDSVKITVDTARIRTNNDTTICKGGSVQLNSVGGQQYSWSPAINLSNPAIANPVASPIATTEYIVTGTNSNGCSAKDTVNVYLFTVPAISVSNDTAICKNTTVQLFASGGTGYTWSPSATLSNPSISNPVASPLSNTKYYVAITDANTCTYTDSVQVDIVPPPAFSVSSNPQVCLNDSVQLNASGGNIYSWTPSASLTNAGIANPLAFPTTTTTYTVIIQETTCNESATLTTQVTVLPLPNITATKANDIDCSYDKSQLNASGGIQYAWTPAGTLSNPSVANPVASPRTATEYIVKGTDVNGCEAYDSVTVNVENVNKGGYLMPSAFTPNNDGLNDCYRIKFWGIVEELEFSIFNRWGERVFYTTDPNKCWDGTYKGVMQHTAVFVYTIKAKTTCESNVFRKGTLLLIR